MTLLVFASMTACTSGPRRDAVLDEMKPLLEGCPVRVHWFGTAHLAVAAAVDDATLQRIERYLETLVARLGPGFDPPAAPVRVFIFDTRERLATYVKAICREEKPAGHAMGFYHRPTRSVLCSMQWGLGWLGDIVVRSWIADDWNGVGSAPNRWFEVAFVSMLYNSFRTPRGDFCGLNVGSYYRPQVQRTIEAGKILPLRRFLRDEWDEALFADDTIRRQGRELLAWLHSRGSLMAFYRAYRETCARDRSAITALEQTVRKPLDEIERDWLAWMMAADGEIGDSEMAKPFPVLGILIARRKEELPGAVIFEIIAGSPASRAALRHGDRIVTIGGEPVTGPDDVAVVLGRQTINTRVIVGVVRDGKSVEVPVTLDRFIDG